MTADHVHHADPPPDVTRVYRFLALICGVVAATQVMMAAVGEENAPGAAVVLGALCAVFVVADRLAAAGHTAPAALVSCAVILVAGPVIGYLYQAGYSAMLLGPVAFVIALPHLRGGQLVGFGMVAAVATGLTASAGLVASLPAAHETGTVALDALTVFAGVTALGGFLIWLVWRLDRARLATGHRYRGLVRDLPVGVARRDAQGIFLEANDALARTMGFPDGGAMVGTRYADRVDPSQSIEQLWDRIATGGLVSGEIWARRLDQERIRVRYTSRATLDEAGRVRWVDSVLEDVTAGHATRMERERLAAIIEAADVAIVTQDREDVILGWNAPAGRLLGWSEDTAGQTVYDVSPPDEWDEIRANNARVLAGEVVGPFEVERTYGERDLRLAITILPVRGADGEIETIATILRDVTTEAAEREERARLEAELRDTLRLEATGRLAAGVAHDFGTLVAAIRGQAVVVAAELPVGHPGRTAADQILRSSGQALELTHQLLVFASRQVLHAEVVDLDALVRAEVPTLQAVVGSVVRLHVAPSQAAAFVSVDRNQLADALVNLALRAREAMPDGGRVTITTSLRRVADVAAGQDGAPSADSGPNEVVLAIADTGRQVPPDVLAHMFEPFYPGEGETAGRGSGLGLAMVQGFVRQSGGRIEVDSDERGTVMTLRFPMAARQRFEPPRPSTPIGGASSAEVLLVDDDAMVRTIARRILVQAGFVVHEAADAAQARTIAAAEDRRFDLLVTDVIMPGMYGPDLARLLRERRPALPVLFVSGFTGDELPDDTIGERSRFLAKPFTSAALVAAVRDLLVEVEPASGA